MKKREPPAEEMIQPPSALGKALVQKEKSDALLILRRAVENVRVISKQIWLLINQIDEKDDDDS